MSEKAVVVLAPAVEMVIESQDVASSSLGLVRKFDHSLPKN
jgi:hypothetical protein